MAQRCVRCIAVLRPTGEVVEGWRETEGNWKRKLTQGLSTSRRKNPVPLLKEEPLCSLSRALTGGKQKWRRGVERLSIPMQCV